MCGGGVSSLPPPARRVPVPVPVPGILEPGKLPSLCGLGMYREVLSVSGLGGKARFLPDLTYAWYRAWWWGVVRCRLGFMPLFGVIIRWVEAGWKGGGGGWGCHSGKYMERSDIPPPSGEEGG